MGMKKQWRVRSPFRALDTCFLYRNPIMKTTISKIGYRLATAAICLAMVAAASAQTVRPVINELHNPAKGWVEYVNDSLTPLNVVLEPKSFTVSESYDISYNE